MHYRLQEKSTLQLHSDNLVTYVVPNVDTQRPDYGTPGYNMMIYLLALNHGSVTGYLSYDTVWFLGSH